MWRMRSRWSIVIGGSLLFGCAGSGDLEPALPESRVDGLDDAAGVVVSRVQIVAQPGEWPEEPEISEHVTPVLVEITNGRSGPLRIEYRLFSLAAGRGRILSPLPPFNVYGTALAPRVMPEGRRIELVFDARGFEVAPHYASVYQQPRASRRPFAADTAYHAATWPEWRRSGYELPTRSMKLMALPEGILHAGGRVSGYLYFPLLPAGAQRVDFHQSLVDAESGRLFAVATVPFVREP
jgi:hypothetical protein